MASPSRRRLIQQVEALEPRMRDAFLDAIESARAETSVPLLSDLLEQGDVDAVVTALGLNAARFAELAESLRVAFGAGGRQGVSELPVLRMDPTALTGGRYRRGARRTMQVRVNFDLRNERAEAWLRNQSAQLVTGIVNDQRLLIRNALFEGTLLGRNPRETALDLVGRMAGGRRVGGIVGLTAQQGSFVAAARAELASGDPQQLRHYLTRTRRDHRFDGIVNRAIASGTPVAAADVDKMAGRYADRLLQLRGENIARTEALAAFSAARDEAFHQAVDTGALDPQNVRKGWNHSGSRHPREDHIAMEGEEVALGEPFTLPSGAQMMYPGDTSLGAGPEDIVNCGCQAIYRVDQIAQAMAEAA